MLNLLAGAAFSRNLAPEMVRSKGSPTGLFRGQIVRTLAVSAICKASAFTGAAKQSPGRPGENSRLQARDGLAKRVYGWTWACRGQVGWYGEAGSKVFALLTQVGSDGCSSRIGCPRNATLLRLAAMDAPPVSDAPGTERY